MRLLVSPWSIWPMSSHLSWLFLSSLHLTSQLGLDEVFYSPRDQTAHEGETVFFPCVSGESLPPATITWLKDGKPVTRGRQVQGEYGGGSHMKTSGTLHLYNITLEDDGIYTCNTYNPLLKTSKRSKSAKLTVQGVPRRLRIIHGPDNVTVAMGEEVSMHCAIDGFPVPMVQWFKDGCLLTNCSASFTLHNNGQLLTFRNVSKDIEGSYHCEAYNQGERVESHKGFLLLADMDWSFVMHPANVTAEKGENVTVTCRPPYSQPPAQVSWFKDNQLFITSARARVISTGDLLLYRVNEHDSGSYFCRASNIHLRRFVTSRRATVTVMAPPSVTVRPQVLTVPVGANAVLQCQVSGYPLPSLSWFKNGLSKQTGGRVVRGTSTATLYIQSTRSYDEGAYVCHAANSLGSRQQKAVLKIAVSPIIVNFSAQVHCRVGESAILPCKAVGIVPITYTWSRKRGNQDIPITLNEEINIDEDGSLHISSVQWSDEGEYYCTALNRAGHHQKRSFLTVSLNQQRPTDTVVLSANSSPKESIAVLEKSMEERLVTVPPLAKQTPTTCVSSDCWGPSENFFKAQTTPSSFHMASPYFVTRMPPPIFPPPPHPGFKSLSSRDQPSVSSNSPFTRFLNLKSPPESAQPEQEGGPARGQHRLVTTSLDFLDSPTQALLVTLALTLPVESQSRSANNPFLQLDSEAMSTQVSETSLEPPIHPLHLKHGDQGLHMVSEMSFSSTTNSPTKIILTSGERQSYTDPPPTFAKSTTDTPLQIQPPVSSTQQANLNSEYTLSQIEASLLNHTPYSIDLFAMTSSTINSTNTSSLDSAFPVDSVSQLQNTSNGAKSFEATEMNTSQSPRVTPRSPSWLPVLEKHDIPVVVGVGVSLAFIFITVTFYSVVQKNEPIPTSRAAQRNVGVPIRHSDCRAAGRTYENRAFEDDDCVAVIEQSPNTRARPPGPGLVTVHLESTSREQQENLASSPDVHSVTMETYPEPILNTKLNHCLDEESGLSVSQSSIQLQCAEDWLRADDNQDPCQDTLPPPSPLLSPSPSPSLSSKQNECVRSSLTLQSADLSTVPLHHSLSVSQSPCPLRLSHHVSVGPTNVAVDVHFHPARTPSISVQSTTHINTSAAAHLPGSQESLRNK